MKAPHASGATGPLKHRNVPFRTVRRLHARAHQLSRDLHTRDAGADHDGGGESWGGRRALRLIHVTMHLPRLVQ